MDIEYSKENPWSKETHLEKREVECQHISHKNNFWEEVSIQALLIKSAEMTHKLVGNWMGEEKRPREWDPHPGGEGGAFLCCKGKLMKAAVQRKPV